MGLSIRLHNQTLKALNMRKEAAFRRGDLRLFKRISALLLQAEGYAPAEIAIIVMASAVSVRQWWSQLLEKGLDSLQYRTPPGRPAHLTPTQKKRLKELIADGPEKAGYATGCWNCALIQALILREFQILYNVHYVAELLHHWGFSYQKARYVSDHLNERKRRAWLRKQWPHIVAEARRRDAWLLFSDEASFAQWGSLAYTWAPVGEQPQVKTSGKRKAFKVFGLMDYFSGRLFYQGLTGRFNAESYCAFLGTVLAQTQQPIILIQDGARYHTAAKTRAFFAAHAQQLTVYQLPSYSPDYNPIEHLWRHVKRAKTHNVYFATFEQLSLTVEDGLRQLQQEPATVRTLMGTYLDDMAGIAAPAH
jgi:transposase